MSSPHVNGRFFACYEPTGVWWLLLGPPYQSKHSPKSSEVNIQKMGVHSRMELLERLNVVTEQIEP